MPPIPQHLQCPYHSPQQDYSNHHLHCPYHHPLQDHSNHQTRMPRAVPAPTSVPAPTYKTGNKSPKPKKVHFATPEVTESYQSEDNQSSGTSSESSSSEEEVKTRSDTPPPAKGKKASSESPSNQMAKSATKDKDHEREGTGKKDKSKTKPESPAKSKGKGKGKGKGKKKRKSKRLVIYINDSETESATSNEETTEESGEKTNEEDNKPQGSQPDPSASNNHSNHNPFYPGFDEERALSNQYYYTQVLSQQYPDQLQIKPDKFWSAVDCSILATLEARYRALKWHHLQSDFYNATGRMVPIELLQAKLESASPNSS